MNAGRRRALLWIGCTAMAACLWWAVYLESSAGSDGAVDATTPVCPWAFR